MHRRIFYRRAGLLLAVIAAAVAGVYTNINGNIGH
jgi:hypothetical protein